MPIYAGALRHRVTILRRPDPEDVDEAGQPLDNPIPIGERWAERRDLVGNRLLAASQIHHEARTEFRFRYTAEITPDMLIRHGGQTFEIVSLADPDGRRRELVALCRSVS